MIRSPCVAGDELYYTVEDAVNQLGFGAFQILVTVFCGMIWVSLQLFIP